jgi:predicted N-acetyltransferase YhbS
MHDLREQRLAVTRAEAAVPEKVQVQKLRKLVREEKTCPLLWNAAGRVVAPAAAARIVPAAAVSVAMLGVVAVTYIGQ